MSLSIGSIPPPQSEQELMQRAFNLAGQTVGQIAEKLKVEVPDSLKRKKGWQGQFIELCLGADSGNLSQPDFSHLGIELKTLPIDYSGKVQESTYVCVLNLSETRLQTWQQSPVCQKLSKVLWVPVAREVGQPTIDSTIATPFLWQANAKDFETIRKDWEYAMEQAATGRIDQLNARHGEILQVRPKAANSRALTKTHNQEGELIETLPRGFYLRPSFTQKILQENLHAG